MSNGILAISMSSATNETFHVKPRLFNGCKPLVASNPLRSNPRDKEAWRDQNSANTNLDAAARRGQFRGDRWNSGEGRRKNGEGQPEQ